ncbi:MAG: tyrosine-type recombinase/integrase [Bifidobacterium crudilactis]|jgi:integrase|nr:tyrosine-type recombinase/integrase [Bifidobacterium crudilactis]MCI1889459.1 tyrosine-type recombinase/integrase [Bifidobacterium crudilactis]
MGRSATGIYKAKAYKTSAGTTRYRARVPVGYYPNGKPKYQAVTASTYREAQNKTTALLREIKEHGAPVDRSTRFADYAQRWLKDKTHDVRPKTRSMYASIISQHISPIAGKPISAIITSDIKEVINDARAHDNKGNDTGPASLSIKRQIKTTINQIMMAALADEIIERNPVLPIKLPKQQKHVDARTKFSVLEMRAMLQASSQMDIRNAARWWFRLLTGLRQGEILGASWEDYDMKTHLYRVNWKLQPLVRDHGCGDPIDGAYPCGKVKGGLCPNAIWRIPDDYEMTHIKGQWALTRPKSKTGRIVPIVDPLAEVLKLLHEATKNEPNPHGLFFHDSEGNPIDPDDDERGLDDLMRTVGIDPGDHTGHETRHSVVSLLAAAGVDFQLIEQIVGHGSIEMVERYRHPDDSERKNAMKTLDASLNLAQIEWKK